MTMLTHGRGRFEPAAYSSGARSTVRTWAANAHLGMIKRFCTIALALGGIAAAAIAVRSAIVCWRFYY